MKQIRFLILLFLLLFVQNSKGAYCEVIFADDFSNWPEYKFDRMDYNPPSGWSYVNGGPGTIRSGIMHYPAEIGSPGRKDQMTNQ